MTLDGFLTFLALTIAFYAVMPEVTRLRARLHLRFQVMLAFVAISLTLYFQFFSLVGQPCWLGSQAACQWITFQADGPITPQQAAFLVVFAWMLLALGLNLFRKPGTQSFPTIIKIVEMLLYERRFGELLGFIRPHLRLIEAAARRELRRQRVHDWLADANWLRHEKFASVRPQGEVMAAKRKASLVERTGRWFRRKIRWTARIVPSGSKAQANAETLVRLLFRSGELRQFITAMRPDVVTDLMAIRLQPRFEFSDAVVEDFIADPGSQLFQEIENSQNVSHTGEYFLNPENKFLQFLFSDASVARQLAVWRPVGEFTITKLRTGTETGYADFLNGPATSFDRERWQDPTFVAIRFFDIMVQSAVQQSVEDHMWLFYLPHFVRELEQTYDATSPNIDALSEFPTRGSRLIYEAVSAMGGWVKSVKYIDASSPHTNIPQSAHLGSSAIPPAAAISLGQAMDAIATSPRIGDTFAASMHDSILHDIASLSEEGVEGRMRAFLVRAMVGRGNLGSDARYGARIGSFLAQADHVLRGNVSDYVAAVEKAYPGALPTRFVE